MSSSTMNSRTAQSRRRWPQVRRFIPALLSWVALTACVAPPLYDPSLDTSSSPLETPIGSGDASATLTPQPSASASGSSTQFTFPMTACGDRSSEPSETWYSVFIDGGNIDEIRSRYCGDAISTTRQSSNTATVQVASFTSYARALSLAKAIGGVVEQTAQAATPSASATPRAERAATPQPTPNPQPAPTPTTAQVGQSAYLSAAEAGAPINIRNSASTSAPIESTAYPGDRVQIANQVQGDDGYPWYQVKLETGTIGWVRGDLVSQTPTTPSHQAAAPPSNPPQSSAPAPAYNANPGQINPNQTNPGYANPGYAPGYIPPGTTPAYPPNNQPVYPPSQPTYPYQQPGTQPNYGAVPGYGGPSYGTAPNYGMAPGYGTNPGYGMPAGRSPILTAQDPDATINIREFAGMNSPVRYQAPSGAPVQVVGSAQDAEGFTWYQVQFSTGAAGWVRGDLLTMN